MAKVARPRRIPVWPSVLFAGIACVLLVRVSSSQKTLDAFALRTACPTCPVCSTVVEREACHETVLPPSERTCPEGMSADPDDGFIVCRCPGREP